jgi:purine-binding chemotaxis protein CheW
MQTGTVMTFGLGDGLFALPVTLVQEILDAQPVSPLPDTPPHLLGVIDVRGASVAVVDLRQLLGLPPRPDAPDTRFVVLLVEHSDRKLPIALRVDRVIEVTGLDGGQIEPVAGAGLLHWDERMVEGLGRRNGTFVTVLRIAGLFDRSDAGAAIAHGIRTEAA